MAIKHYAKVDGSNKVLDTIVIDTSIMSAESGWVSIAATMRVLACVGSYYNTTLENFSGNCPYESWTINASTNVWEAPLSKPSTHDFYQWDEVEYQRDNTKGWVSYRSDVDESTGNFIARTAVAGDKRIIGIGSLGTDFQVYTGSDWVGVGTDWVGAGGA